MAISTYSELVSAIQNWLDRPDDPSDRADEFIDLAEAAHKRDVRIREMLSRSTLSISDGDRYVDLPSDFLDHKYLRIQTPNDSYQQRYYPDLVQLTIHELSLESVNLEGAPRYYAIHEQIEFDREADQDYTGELFYYVELTALSDSNTTNALLTRAPDVYLYGALLHSAPWLHEDERLKTWANLYTAAVNKLNSTQAESKRGSPLVSRVSGATP